MKKLLILSVAAPLLFASCAQNSMTGDTYTRGEAGRAQSVNPGRITSIRYVKIEGNNKAGAVLGGIAGGFLGNEIGSGSAANTAGAIGGAAAGAALGSHLEQAIGSRQGIEINVDLDSGRSVSVVQEVNKRETFSVGDRVRVLSNGSTSRVTH
ncbi:glycine zipper 2TM domain-containing protein [Rubritalea spongiae]|uniref:Glycine zipper 2TM domain-containing protein n=1 Tax=Rubritalea spongiae TaxID=430797 RepID=A0ABW5E0X2_9BACT